MNCARTHDYMTSDNFETHQIGYLSGQARTLFKQQCRPRMYIKHKAVYKQLQKPEKIEIENDKA